MKAAGRKWLILTGFLEVLFGAASVALIIWMLNQNPADYKVFSVNAKETLWALILIYAIAGIQILSGLVGMVLSGNIKKAGICQFFGLLLILVQVVNYAQNDFTVSNIIYNSIALIVPAFYYYGACRNKKQLRERESLQN